MNSQTSCKTPSIHKRVSLFRIPHLIFFQKVSTKDTSSIHQKHEKQRYQVFEVPDEEILRGIEVLIVATRACATSMYFVAVP